MYILSALVFLAVWAAPASADLCNPCTASISPGTDIVEITLLNWLVPTDATSVTVVEPPVYGSWNSIDQTYTPSPEFWQVGGDSVTFLVMTATGRSDGLKTLVLTPAHENLTIDETFCAGDPSNDWTFEGDLPGNISTSGNMNQPNTSVIDFVVDNGQTAYLESNHIGGHETGDPNAVAGTLEIGVSEPPLDDLEHLLTTVLELDGLVRIDIDREDDSTIYQVQSSFFDNRFDCGSSCGTGWVTLTEDKLYRLTVKGGQEVIGPAEENNWTLRLKIEEVLSNGSLVFVDQSEISAPKDNWDSQSNPVVPLTRFGAVATQTNDANQNFGGGVFQVKCLERTSSNIFQDSQTGFAGFNIQTQVAGVTLDFEPLLTDGLVDTGNDSPVDHHAVADLEDVEPLVAPAGTAWNAGAINRAVWTTNVPVNAGEVTVLVDIDTTNANIPIGTTTGVIELGETDSSGGIAANVILKTNHLGQRSMAMQVIENDGGAQTSAYVPVSSEPIQVALVWRKGDGTNDGSADLWVNKIKTSLPQVDNSTLSVERATIGLTRVRYINVPDSGSKPILFDNFFVKHK